MGRRFVGHRARPAEPALYERFCGGEVRFSRPLDRLVLPASAVDARLATSGPEPRAFFRAPAEAAGFRDQKSFRRAFRRQTGRSPSAYQLKS